MRAAALSLLFLTLLQAACERSIEEGRYACDPGVPASCPEGYFCFSRGSTGQFRCYPSAVSHCGDGFWNPEDPTLEGLPDEECEGSALPDTTCRDLGYYMGPLSCDSSCGLSTEQCSGFAAIASRYNHTCGLLDTGTAYCWGDDRYGQLGAGMIHDTAVRYPLQVVSTVPLVSIAPGGTFTWAIDTDGTAWYWGSLTGNEEASAISSTPRKGGEGVWTDAFPFKDARAGLGHVCLRTIDDRLTCLGYDTYGQLGRGSTSPYMSLTREFVDLNDFAADYTVGHDHGCLVTPSDELWCWGKNESGQLGDGTVINRPSPVAVLSGVVRVEAGADHTCALDTEGALWCWGDNAYGQVDYRGTPGLVTTPRRVQGVPAADDLSLGTWSTCVKEAGLDRWSCFGGDELGQLGHPDACTFCDPSAIDTPLASMAAGNHTACGLSPRGLPLCFGKRSLAGSLSVAPLVPNDNVHLTEITCGAHTACAIDETGHAFCWGNNKSNQTGTGNPDAMVTTPTPLSSDATFSAIAVGRDHGCALTADATPLCWGDNTYGQLGTGDTLPSPVPVPLATPITGKLIDVGLRHTCLSKTNYSFLCWGDNSFNQLGGMVIESFSTVPRVVYARLFAHGLSTGDFHTCIIDEANRIQCWGDNSLSQCGMEGTDIVLLPDFSGTLEAGKSLQAGPFFTCAVDHAGLLRCWGDNSHGQLATGLFASSSTPSVVTGLLGATVNDVLTGSDHVCAILSTGAMRCWGSNTHGQLGTDSVAWSVTPMEAFRGTTFIKGCAGDRYTCGITTDGTTLCWGDNSFGQLGVPESESERLATPTPVAAPLSN